MGCHWGTTVSIFAEETGFSRAKSTGERVAQEKKRKNEITRTWSAFLILSPAFPVSLH